MDLPLLRQLQLMKSVEDDPSNEFGTEKIDLKTFTPKYSQVIIVDQRVDKSQLKHSVDQWDFGDIPPGVLFNVEPSKTRFIFNSLSMALEYISHASQISSELQGWTVILKEGLYINGLGSQTPNVFANCRQGQPMEIVGLKEVRLLFTHDLETIFNIGMVNIIIRNIRIYDCRPNPAPDHKVFEVNRTKCQLIDVKIHAPKASGVSAFGVGSVTKIVHCTLKTGSLQVQDGSIIRAENCRISASHFPGIPVAMKSIFHAINVQFTERTQIDLTFKGNCILDACKFETQEKSFLYTNNRISALYVRSEGNLDCRGSTFIGYPSVLSTEGYGTSATMRHCNFFNITYPMFALTNSSVSITDSTISSNYLLHLFNNSLGKVEFLRNKTGPRTELVVKLDKSSKKPTIDIKDVIFEVDDSYQEPPLEAKDRMRSKVTKELRGIYRNGGSIPGGVAHAMRNRHKWALIKYCEMCGELDASLQAALLEGHGVKVASREKFRYCSGCRAVCYCSKECQEAHWVDHRIVCSGKAAPKAADGSKKSKNK